VIDSDTVRFADGVAYQTSLIATVSPDDRIAADGATYAKALALPAAKGDWSVELRGVTLETIDRASGRNGVCGDLGVTHIALAADRTEDAAIKSLVAAAFAGIDQPGPLATQSRLCGVFVYGPAKIQDSSAPR
jgi:hypothetical protein